MMLLNRKIILSVALTILLTALSVQSADVITNGTFDTDLSDWLFNIQTANGSRDWDNTIFGAVSGSFRYKTNTGRRQEFIAYDSISIPTVIDQSDQIFLNLYWYKYADFANALTNNITIFATESGTTTTPP